MEPFFPFCFVPFFFPAPKRTHGFHSGSSFLFIKLLIFNFRRRLAPIGTGVGFGVGTGVGFGVGFRVGTGVGFGVGSGVGTGVGFGVGTGVGFGVGSGVGTGVGFGVGSGLIVYLFVLAWRWRFRSAGARVCLHLALLSRRR